MTERDTVLAVMLVAVLSSCGGASEFQCMTNEQCGVDGTCQPTGLCSFPDDACPSGQRYGTLAGSLAGECVHPDVVSGDGTTSDTGGPAGTSSDGGSTGEPSCPACVPDSPPGWSGPVVSLPHTGAGTVPECPAFAPVQVAEGFAGLVAGPAQCSCACGIGTDCSGVSGSIHEEQGGGCGPITTDLGTLTPGECIALGDVSNETLDVEWNVDPAQACAPAPTAQIPEPTWTTTIRLCAIDDAPLGCADGVCQPTVPEGSPLRYCIFRSGGEACPDGAYSQATPLFESFTDTRTCSACACAADDPAAAVCTLEPFVEPECPDSIVPVELVDSSSGDTCVPLDGIGPFGNDLHIRLDANCVASGGEPQGDAMPATPLTVCCMP